MKIKIVYFAYLVPNKWISLVSNQLNLLKSIGLYEQADEIYLSASGEKEELDKLDKLINFLYPKINIVNCSTSNNFEYLGFKTLYEVSESDSFILYFHTKGITSNSIIDRSLLELFTISNFKQYLHVFSESKYDIGCLLPSQTGFAYFNFFWVNGDYIKTHLSPPQILESRWGWELYINQTHDDYLPLLYSPLNKVFNPYDKSELFLTLDQLKTMYLTDLDQLMISHGTDKNSQHHNYVPFYKKYFESLRTKSLKLLEIGIFRPIPNRSIKDAVAGASLKTWENYFPTSLIIGADINNFKDIETDRIKTIQANQEKRQGPNSLNSIIDEYGSEFDIIIDDGGHTMEQQQVTLGHMFQFLKSKGIFVIEDLHTSYLYPSYNPTRTSYNTLKMLEEFKLTNKINSDFITSQEKDYLEANIESINIYKGKSSEIAFIIKK